MSRQLMQTDVGKKERKILSLYQRLFLICLLIQIPLWMSLFQSLEIQKFGTLPLWRLF